MRLTTSVLAVVLVVVGVLLGQKAATQGGAAPAPAAPAAAAPAENQAAGAANKPAGNAPAGQAGQATKKAWPIAFAETPAPATKVVGTTFTFSTLVTNASREPHDVKVTAFLREVNGAQATVKVSCVPNGTPSGPTCDVKLQPGATFLVVTGEVSGDREVHPLGGFITIEPKVSPPAGTWTEEQPLAKLALAAIPNESSSNVDATIVGAARFWAIVAVVVAALLCAILWGPLVWFRRMGVASFSFDSWNTALMIGGPLLTGILTTYTGFPENPHALSKKSYLFMSLLLTALIAFGPAIYNLLRVPTETTDANGKPITENQGIVLGFFLAAVVALTGGLGQVGLLGTLFGDLGKANIVSTELGTILTGGANALFWLIVIGSVFSMIFTVAVFAKPTKADENSGPVTKVAARMEESVQADPTRGGGAKRLPSWSLP